jgi:hypothetical protein
VIIVAWVKPCRRSAVKPKSVEGSAGGTAKRLDSLHQGPVRMRQAGRGLVGRKYMREVEGDRVMHVQEVVPVSMARGAWIGDNS